MSATETFPAASAMLPFEDSETEVQAGCPQCGVFVGTFSTRCWSCGAEFAGDVCSCASCGYEVPAEANVCPNCLSNLN